MIQPSVSTKQEIKLMGRFQIPVKFLGRDQSTQKSASSSEPQFCYSLIQGRRKRKKKVGFLGVFGILVQISVLGFVQNAVFICFFILLIFSYGKCCWVTEFSGSNSGHGEAAWMATPCSYTSGFFYLFAVLYLIYMLGGFFSLHCNSICLIFLAVKRL